MKRGFKIGLLKQVDAQSKEDAEKRSIISRRNTSRFFTQIYQYIYGGKINFGKKGNLDIFLENGRKNFSPDIVESSGNGIVYTEVKSHSVRMNSPHCSITQLENYCYFFLNKLNSKRVPRVDYSIFRYGDWNTHGLQKLNSSQFVDKLSEVNKKLLILPLNLVFFLLTFSRHERRDQTNSESPLDFQDYFMPRGKILTRLQDGNCAISDLISSYGNLSELEKRFFRGLEDLALQDLQVDKTLSPRIQIEHRGKIYCVKPFPITKYFHNTKKYQKWLAHFSKNHERIMEDFGLRNLFEEKRIVYNPKPEEDEIPY